MALVQGKLLGVDESLHVAPMVGTPLLVDDDDDVVDDDVVDVDDDDYCDDGRPVGFKISEQCYHEDVRDKDGNGDYECDDDDDD